VIYLNGVQDCVLDVRLVLSGLQFDDVDLETALHR
jgi:hypothetical protein